MRDINKLIASTAIALGLTAGSSYGATFDFSYQFGDGNQATGTIDGTLNGNFVDNITGVTLSLNGSAVTGPLFTATYVLGSVTANGEPGTFAAGPIVSFDATMNNFVFANVDPIPAGTGPGSQFFSMFPTGNDAIDGNTDPFAFEGAPAIDVDLPTVAANWSLTAESVPDGGSTVALLGSVMAGIGLIRRKR